MAKYTLNGRSAFAKANITKEDYIDTTNYEEHTFEYRRKSIAKFNFNKSLRKGFGSFKPKGKLKIYEKSDDIAKIKVKQDLNGDGQFTKDELVYKATIKNVEYMDALINFEGEIKLKRYMSECEWEHLKNPGEPIACAEEFDPGYTKLTLAPILDFSDQDNEVDFMPFLPHFSPQSIGYIVLSE